MLYQSVGGLLFLLLGIDKSGSFPKCLAPEVEAEYIAAMENGDISARNKLVEHNLRLVAYMAKKYYMSAIDPDDLVQIGSIGLMKAIDTFSSSKGIKLSSYASRCIENEILMSLRLCKKSAQDISISEPIDSDNQGNALTLVDVIAQEDTIADDLDKQVLVSLLYKCLAKITDERARYIIAERYGLSGKKPRTQKDVADELGISRSYVSRIEKKTLRVLCEMMAEVGF
jgi:RNA polymerase sporulation-specific sigma factor